MVHISLTLFGVFSTSYLSVTVDGAMLASRDFGFMLTQGTMTMLLQLFLLRSAWCSTISAVFGTFTIRLGSYAVSSLIRAGLGRGKLGRALRGGIPIDGAAVNGSATIKPLKNVEI